jgi:hypothetical protein
VDVPGFVEPDALLASCMTGATLTTGQGTVLIERAGDRALRLVVPEEGQWVFERLARGESLLKSAVRAELPLDVFAKVMMSLRFNHLVSPQYLYDDDVAGS